MKTAGRGWQHAPSTQPASSDSAKPLHRRLAKSRCRSASETPDGSRPGQRWARLASEMSAGDGGWGLRRASKKRSSTVAVPSAAIPPPPTFPPSLPTSAPSYRRQRQRAARAITLCWLAVQAASGELCVVTSPHSRPCDARSACPRWSSLERRTGEREEREERGGEHTC